MGLKHLGVGICIVGSIFAILFPPCTLFGTFAGWHFLFECETEQIGGYWGVPAKTITYCTYEFIDVSALILELILINGIGLALFFIGKSKKVVNHAETKIDGGDKKWKRRRC